ncbi:ferritin heavy chain-like [Hippopotamus amphibius kiboko]|uniref:ferritin heavy chain-like n=1 Tax=Hippopotamus amphibius kiboko TaxID=575201 RepID=UPI002597FCF0|nr:ferritin heavy chain-like [Hippopotamus amphibius kiboko]
MELAPFSPLLPPTTATPSLKEPEPPLPPPKPRLCGRYRHRHGLTLTFTPTVTAPLVMLPPPPRQMRQNYHPDCEAAVNSHTTLELHISYVYLAVAFYLEHDGVALKQFISFFQLRSRKHGEQAEGLMRLQNQCGGRLCFCDIRKPDTNDWESGLKAMQCTLLLEKRINQSLFDLHQLATNKSDPQLCHFLQTHYLNRQVEFIKELGDHVTSPRKMGTPDVDMAEYLFDKLTLGDGNKKN